MASINRLKRELVFKIVFYGPGLGGKTTTLRYVHGTTKPENRGNMVTLATDMDRTLYFDFLPIKLLRFGNMGVKLQLYTVPGQVYYAATRKLVLSGADGIVFVADTQAARFDSNHESLDDLTANLAEQGRKLSAVPHAFQWNKRDLPGLVSLEEADRRLNLFGAPAVPTIATSGEGVFDTLERITRLVVDAYRADLPGAARVEGFPLFLDPEELGLTDAIRDLADSQPAKAPSSGSGANAAAVKIAPAVEGTLPSSGSSSRAVPEAARGSPIGAAGRAAWPNGKVFSFTEAWPPSDRDVALRVEQALAAGDGNAAVGACHDLFGRVVAAAGELLGDRPEGRDPALVVALLGLDGTRYLGFAALGRRSKSVRPCATREALEAYAFVLEARRALDRVRA